MNNYSFPFIFGDSGIIKREVLVVSVYRKLKLIINFFNHLFHSGFYKCSTIRTKYREMESISSCPFSSFLTPFFLESCQHQIPCKNSEKIEKSCYKNKFRAKIVKLILSTCKRGIENLLQKYRKTKHILQFSGTIFICMKNTKNIYEK